MNSVFNVSQAAKILLADMMRLNTPFNRTWEDYNETWYDGRLLESDKDRVIDFISETIDAIE